MMTRSIATKLRLRNAVLDERAAKVGRRENSERLRHPVRRFSAIDLSPAQRAEYGLSDWDGPFEGEITRKQQRAEQSREQAEKRRLRR